MIDLQWLHNHPTEVFECISKLEAENRELKAQVEQLKLNIDIGAKDYCNLMERHDALFVEVDHLKTQSHIVDATEMVYEWREIGETDWAVCNEEWFVICELSPNCDTRKRLPSIDETKAKAFKKGFEACINASVELGMIDADGEFANQLRKAAKEQQCKH